MNLAHIVAFFLFSVVAYCAFPFRQTTTIRVIGWNFRQMIQHCDSNHLEPADVAAAINKISADRFTKEETIEFFCTDLPPIMRAYRASHLKKATFRQAEEDHLSGLSTADRKGYESTMSYINYYYTTWGMLADDLADRASSLRPSIVKVIQSEKTSLRTTMKSNYMPLVERIAKQGYEDGVITCLPKKKTLDWFVIWIICMVGFVVFCGGVYAFFTIRRNRRMAREAAAAAQAPPVIISAPPTDPSKPQILYR